MFDMNNARTDFTNFLQSILDEHAPVFKIPGPRAIEAYTGMQDKLSGFKSFLEDYNVRVDERIAELLDEESDAGARAQMNDELLTLAKEYAMKFRNENF
jgi:hypothetical protein